MPEFEKTEPVVARICEMEARFDRLLEGHAEENDLPVLLQYYESSLWRADFQLDEQGLLPPALKRGILSEDGFYNFLTERGL